MTCQTQCVPCPAPFDPPLRTPDPADGGWVGGRIEPPTWVRIDDSVYTSGLHELLRSAGLPGEELLHMGATWRMLSTKAPILTHVEPAADLLGRIAIDAWFHERGGRYGGDPADPAIARALGAAVIEEWFA